MYPDPTPSFRLNSTPSPHQVLSETLMLMGVNGLISALTSYLSWGLCVSGRHPLLSQRNGLFSLILMVPVLVFPLLQYWVQIWSDKPKGLVPMILLSAFLGYWTTPCLYFFLHPGASQAFFYALLGIGLNFLFLSLYALRPVKIVYLSSANYYAAFMAMCCITVLMLIFHSPFFTLLSSCIFLLISSFSISEELNRIMLGEQVNSISAAATLYTSLYLQVLNLAKIIEIFLGKNDRSKEKQ